MNRETRRAVHAALCYLVRYGASLNSIALDAGLDNPETVRRWINYGGPRTLHAERPIRRIMRRALAHARDRAQGAPRRIA